MSNIIRSKVQYLVAAIFVCLLTLVVSSISAITVKAEPIDAPISWTTAVPNTYSSFTVSELPSTVCQGLYQMKEIAGEPDVKKVCIRPGNNVQFGIFYLGNGSTFLPAVSFPNDSKMHRVNGVCGQYDNCLYLSGSDTLVTKQYMINGLVRSLVVYKNFSHRLTPVISGLIPALSYDFDSSNPDYVFKSAEGYAWPVGGLGASDNGKWLAIEFRQRGIGLLNIETLQMKRVSIMAFSYGTGYDPTSELAVSNDGGHVAVMGNNAGLKIFDNTANCGDEATDGNMSSVSPIVVSCLNAPIYPDEFIYRLANAYKPSFSSDGGELDFYATSYAGELRQVSLRAAGYQTQRLDYLALGDSFSSGEGDLDDSYYLGGTNNGDEKCHTSTRSYPYLVANLLNIDPNYMKSVACSGARTIDIVGMDSSYLGQSDRLGENGLNLSNVDRVLAQSWAKEYFLPGRVHQESFVSKYKPSVITVGIGGNDAGLMQKLTACIGPDTCDWAGSAEGREKSAIEIKNLFGKLVQTYQSLHAASPRTKIYAVGYPNIIDPIGQCSVLTNFLLSDSEKRFIGQGLTYLNQVVEAAAGAAGIKYIDIQSSYGANVICGAETPNAVNLIKLGDDFSPISSLEWMRVIGQESFHPNYLGHVYAAGAIIDSVGDIMAYDYCGGVTICPNGGSAPEPSSYWIPDQYHNYPIAKISDYVFDRDNASDDRQKKLVVASNSLAPGSSVSVEITSDPRFLGQFEANSEGGLIVDVDLSIDLEEGYHTVHLYGTSYSGDSIELYQVIEYRLPYIAADDQPNPDDNTTGDVTDDTNEYPIDDTTDGSGDIDDVEDEVETVDLVDNEDDATNDAGDLSGALVDKGVIPILNSLVKPSTTPEDEIASVSNLSDIYEIEKPDESIAMASEQLVKGVSTVKDNPSALTELASVEKEGRFSIYLIIGALCVIAMVAITLILRKRQIR